MLMVVTMAENWTGLDWLWWLDLSLRYGKVLGFRGNSVDILGLYVCVL